MPRERAEGRFDLRFTEPAARVRVHGHCHQKAAGVMPEMAAALAAVPGIEQDTIESSCCGMAGAFGYQAETVDVSRAMGELSLLPEVRGMGPGEVLVANGTSCRHQISDGTGRRALHLVEFLDQACRAGEFQDTSSSRKARP